MKSKFLTFICFLFSVVVFSQTTDLVAGDIAILQYNTSPTAGTEVIQFIAKRGMESGTVINFTDNGWSGTALNTDEGTAVWTAPSNVLAGDVFTLTLSGATFDLTSSGDQLIAYQGSAGSEIFLYAIQGKSTGAWDADAADVNSSVIPTGLTTGTTALVITTISTGKPTNRQVDFKYNTTSFSGTSTAIITDISTIVNWIGVNASPQTYSGTFASETTWSGSAWAGNTTNPSESFKAIIDGNYSGVSFTANELEITSGNTLTVVSGVTVTVINGITNGGTILIEDNGSLVQGTKDAPNTGTANTVEKTTTSLPSRNVFTYWSSPLASSTLAEISATSDAYYSFVSASQAWSVEGTSTAMTPGVSYATEGPNSGSYPQTYTASFTGSAFNNGDISVSLSFNGGVDDSWNLIGNPYPSAIDADIFLAANTANIGGTLYFWTHNTDASSGQNFSQDDYALWNGTGGTMATSGGVTPAGFIASGQGFFTQALSTGTVTNLFTNAMRVTGNNDVFFKSSNANNEKDRIWLNLSSDSGFSQLLIGFFDDATNGFDNKYDGIRLESGAKLSFNSLIGTDPYAIQGKASLTKQEAIPLAFTANILEDFKISIDSFEGELNSSRINLWDNELYRVHNLKESDYHFTIDATGTYNDRFVLLISNAQDVFDNPIKKPSELIVIQNTDQLKVKTSNSDIISQVLVYDMLGRELINTKSNNDNIILTSNNLKSNTIIIIKAILKTGEVFVKKHYKK